MESSFCLFLIYFSGDSYFSFKSESFFVYSVNLFLSNFNMKHPEKRSVGKLLYDERVKGSASFVEVYVIINFFVNVWIFKSKFKLSQDNSKQSYSILLNFVVSRSFSNSVTEMSVFDKGFYCLHNQHCLYFMF